MPARIDYNSGNIGRANDLRRSYKSLLKAAEKLSSGLRLNRASDDPAELIISERMRSQIASLNQEIENTTLAIAKYNTADATISQLHTITQGIRSMTVDAANSAVYDQPAREAYQAAADMAVANYNHIVETACFNNTPMLDGSEGSLADLAQLNHIDLSDPERARESLEFIDLAISQLNQAQVEIGSIQKYELEARRSNLEVTAQNLTAAESGIRDLDYPRAIVDMIRNEIAVKAGIALMAHANMNHRAVLSLFGD